MAVERVGLLARRGRPVPFPGIEERRQLWVTRWAKRHRRGSAGQARHAGVRRRWRLEVEEAGHVAEVDAVDADVTSVLEIVIIVLIKKLISDVITIEMIAKTFNWADLRNFKT